MDEMTVVCNKFAKHFKTPLFMMALKQTYQFW
jgi:hypothetical protein